MILFQSRWVCRGCERWQFWIRWRSEQWFGIEKNWPRRESEQFGQCSKIHLLKGLSLNEAVARRRHFRIRFGCGCSRAQPIIDQQANRIRKSPTARQVSL